MQSERAPHSLLESMSETFRFGPSYAKPGCCGKPVGCTNTSESCGFRRHPWKRTVLPAPADIPEAEWRMAVQPKVERQQCRACGQACGAELCMKCKIVERAMKGGEHD